MDTEYARHNMIEQQIRPWEVLDLGVLDLIEKIHREDFVADEYKQLSYADIDIPLSHGQTTMTPKVEARLLQSLAVKPADTILEIGTGCAYLTALLARSGQSVCSVDIYPEFTETASDKLQRYELDNVELQTGDAIHGWNKDKTYDVIAVTGSILKLNNHFQSQLSIGGRLFVVVGESPAMEAMLVTRVGDNEWSRESLFETDLPPLVGAEKVEEFEF